MDVLICGYYGFGNLGDELLAEAVVSLLEDAGIKKERIGILSSSPELTAERLGVRAFDRWSISSVHRAVNMTKTMLLGGGGLFQDSTSIRSCLYYWWIVRLASFCGAVPWTVGQSIGPLGSPVARHLARKAFSLCVYRGVRNKDSLDILNNWGYKGFLAPDPVMSLKIRKKSDCGDAILLNIRVGYERISNLAVKFAADYAKENGLKIIGVAFSDGDIDEFEKYCDSGLLKLDQITVVKNMTEFENIIGKSKCAVGMRLHFLILSHLAGLPVCGAPYDPKVSVFCEEWNIPVIGGGTENFSDPAGQEQLDDAAGKIRESLRQGLEIAIGDKYGKKQDQ